MEYVDKETLEPCPTSGNSLCTITDSEHLHIAKHMVWWICPKCGFDAKKFEPREEKQQGAMNWHIALGEENCLRLKAKEEARQKKQEE